MIPASQKMKRLRHGRQATVFEYLVAGLVAIPKTRPGITHQTPRFYSNTFNRLAVSRSSISPVGVTSISLPLFQTVFLRRLGSNPSSCSPTSSGRTAAKSNTPRITLQIPKPQSASTPDPSCKMIVSIINIKHNLALSKMLAHL